MLQVPVATIIIISEILVVHQILVIMPFLVVEEVPVPHPAQITVGVLQLAPVFNVFDQGSVRLLRMELLTEPITGEAVVEELTR